MIDQLSIDKAMFDAAKEVFETMILEKKHNKGR